MVKKVFKTSFNSLYAIRIVPIRSIMVTTNLYGIQVKKLHRR